MKILLQNSLFYPRVIGGAEISTYHLARQLSRRQLAIDCLATTGQRSGDSVLTTRTLEGVQGRVFEASSSGLCDFYSADQTLPDHGLLIKGLHHLSMVHSPRWLRLAREALAQSRPDILHTNTIVGMTPAVWQAARELEIPVVHTLRDYHLLCPRTTLLRSDLSDCIDSPLPCKILAKLKLARTKNLQVVTASSRFVLEKHRRAGGFPQARFEVVPNACEEIPPEIPDRSKQIFTRGLFLGQFAPHKGVSLLLEVLNVLFLDSNIEDLQFDFAGEGPLAAEVRAFCTKFKGRARYHGQVSGEAKSRLLREASFLMIPSLWNEIFDRTILDAFSWGLPVIGTARGGIPEVVQDGKDGSICEPEAESMAAAIRRFVIIPELRLSHGRSAREKSLEFTLDRQVDRFISIYRLLWNEPTGRADER